MGRLQDFVEWIKEAFDNWAGTGQSVQDDIEDDLLDHINNNGGDSRDHESGGNDHDP